MFRCLPNSSKDASRRQSTRLLAEVGNREWGTGNMIGSYRTFARDSMSVCSQQRMKLYHSLLPTSYSPLPTPDFQDRFIEEEAETGTKSNDASFLSTQHSALRKRSLLERLEPLRVRGERHCDSVLWLARHCCNQVIDQ